MALAPGTKLGVYQMLAAIGSGGMGDKATSAGGQWQVSTAGGLFPRWRADGRELYYIGPDGQMMAAPITITGTVLEPGTPVALFQTRIIGGGTDTNPGRQYDVTRDDRFLINTVLEDAAAPITLLQNWKPPNTLNSGLASVRDTGQR